MVTVVETYSGTLFEPCIVKSELTDTSKTNDNNKSQVESANKPVLNAAIKITREKILALMLLNRANYK